MVDMVFSPMEEVTQPGILVVEEIIREYPALFAAAHERRDTIRTADLRASRSGKGGRRDPTANAAMWELHPEAERRYQAVRKAITQTQHRRNGLVRMRLMDLVYWKRTHTIIEAAGEISCTAEAAKQYQAEFIQTVKTALGITDCEGCRYYREILARVWACHYCWDVSRLRICGEDGCYSKELERCPYYETEAI